VNATLLLPDRTDQEYLEMEAMLMAFIDDVRSEATASEPLARLRQLAAAHVRWRLEHPAIAEVFDIALGVRTRVNRLPDEHRRRIRAIKRMYLDELRAVLKAGARAGTFDYEDVRVTAFALVTLCGSAHTWYDPDGDLTVDEVAEMYADFAAGMVRAPMRVAPA
jgi:AcrR family transcriptional regulator